MKQVRAPIVHTTSESLAGFCFLGVEAPEVASVAEPGQFFMIRCGNGPEPLLRRPFSVHKVLRSQVDFLFKIKGLGTQRLAKLHKGDILDLIGPLGQGFSIGQEASNLVLVGGGMGIAPLVFLALKATDEGKSVTLLSGAPTASLLHPYELMSPQLDKVYVTEDGSRGDKGMVTDVVMRYADLDDPSTQIFACGPLSMYRDMACRKEYANKPVQVSLEVMMGCGVGACYGCTVNTKNGPKRVCLDGPVFDLHDILWEEIADPC